MKIDFFRMQENKFNNNEVKDFINELSNYLERKDNEEILEKIKQKNKVSLTSENRMIIEKNEIIKHVGATIGRPSYKEQTQKKIKSEILKMTNRVLKNQNENLEKYRKEGHLYMVEEDVNHRIYLVDLTSKCGYVFEEVDFPKDLVKQATEGAVFKYENGTYIFYSNDGFERLYDN